MARGLGEVEESEVQGAQYHYKDAVSLAFGSAGWKDGPCQ